MINDFLHLGFQDVGQFRLCNQQLIFEHIDIDYNPSNIVYVVLTDSEILYIGETINDMNDVLQDLVNGNKNRDTRNRINSLVEEYIEKYNIYFLVDESGVNSKGSLIKQFQPNGNINEKY